MDLSFTPAQVALHDRLAEFGASENSDDLIERDMSGEFRRKDWIRCAEAGILGLPLPEEYGGAGESALTCAHAMEGFGLGCLDNGLLIAVGAHIWAVELPILKYGTDEQKHRYLPALADGRSIGAHAITEAGSGSDALAMAATARRDGEYYVLNGQKRFVTNAPVADVFLVYANINPRLGFTGVTAFLIDRDLPGISVTPGFEKAGLRTAPWGEIALDGCRVPAIRRLGREKEGGRVFGITMAWERALILAPLLGVMRRQINDCVEHARTRTQFGHPIGHLQSVSNSVVDMQVRLEAARLLIYRAAWELTNGVSGSAFPEMAQLHTSEAAVRTFLDAIQVFGGYGYTKEAQIERNLRDVLGTRISSGTSDIQRHLIAAKLGLLDPPTALRVRLSSRRQP